MKTKERVLRQSYLNINDIAVLLGCSWRKAKQTYLIANEIDDEMRYRVEPHKVRLQTVLKVTGLNLNMLMKQAER